MSRKSSTKRSSTEPACSASPLQPPAASRCCCWSAWLVGLRRWAPLPAPPPAAPVDTAAPGTAAWAPAGRSNRSPVGQPLPPPPCMPRRRCSPSSAACCCVPFEAGWAVAMLSAALASSVSGPRELLLVPAAPALPARLTTVASPAATALPPDRRTTVTGGPCWWRTLPPAAGAAAAAPAAAYVGAASARGSAGATWPARMGASCVRSRCAR